MDLVLNNLKRLILHKTQPTLILGPLNMMFWWILHGVILRAQFIEFWLKVDLLVIIYKYILFSIVLFVSCVLWHINPSRLFNTKSCFIYIYIYDL